ncbi:pyridoxal phosphate-dependent transferase [Aspergillus karnatakaensis]|uniref:pyridoxal phosphate-dependent transferase n=1 Tax=Aspergillus karnatakaensis TaxID=1810916 RepID=UPI003CCE4126
MSDEHTKRVERYSATRNAGKQGILSNVLAPSKHNHIITCSDNDYLNLVNNKEVIVKQMEDLLNNFARRNNSKASVFLAQNDVQTTLEKDVGAWFEKECYFAKSGYAANVGVIHAVCSPGMHVYIDQLLPASFYYDLAARRVVIHVFNANNVADCEAQIKKHGPGMIIIESIYSTSGSFAPLEDFVRLKKATGCVLFVDESHSLGLFGAEGRGLVHTKGLVNDVDYITASLAKAFATRAGIVFTDNATYVKENSYPFIFSSGLVRNNFVRIRAVWEVIKRADDRAAQLQNISTFFRGELNKVPRVVGGNKNAPSAIISLAMKGEGQSTSLHQFLSTNDVLATPFVAPATTLTMPILRFTVHVDLTAKEASMVADEVAEWYVRRAAKI